MEYPSGILPALNALNTRGTVYLTGGAVRDLILGRAPDDFDFEVFGVSPSDILETLRALGVGRVTLEGNNFGVFSFYNLGCKAQFAPPRRDNKIGVGAKGFLVDFFPNMPISEAASRRDYTIGAMYLNTKTSEIVDPYNGRLDLEAGLLRAVDPVHFAEDPKRVYRGAYLASKLGLCAEDTTAALCKQLLPEKRTVSPDATWGYIAKWLSQREPSRGLVFLHRAGWLEPEYAALLGCPQSPVWHPEGSVWTHTKLVMDYAAAQEYDNDDHRVTLVLAALLHDIGKPETTVIENDRITSRDHAAVGADKVPALCRRWGVPAQMAKDVEVLVREHMSEAQTDTAVRRLTNRLSPVSFEDWLRLVEADNSGRPPLPQGLPWHAITAKEIAERLRVTQEQPKSLLSGDEIMLLRKLRPSKKVGEIKAALFAAQLDGAVIDRDAAITFVKNLEI